MLRTLRATASLLAASILVLLAALPAAASNDPLFDRQWALAQVRAPDAWASSTGTGVTIGVVDTGADLTHEDLAGKIVSSANCIGGPCRTGSGQGQDDHGHGTHVSGIAAAVKDNAKGIAGVAPDAKLVVAKALDRDGSGTTTDIAVAIDWVVSQGARVVNLSFGPDTVKKVALGSNSLLDAINHAWDLGAVPVLAAGNQSFLGLGNQNYGNVNALVVGATDRGGSVASYSSSLGNAKWALVAPGGAGGQSTDADFTEKNIISTWLAGNYAASAGTSMAAPHVAGAVALLLAQGLGREAAVQRVLDTADRSVACGTGCHGRLDIARAVGAGPGSASPNTTAPARPSGPAPIRGARPPAPPATTTPPTTVVAATPPSSEPPAPEPSSTAAPPVPNAVALGRPKSPGGGGQSRTRLLASATVILGAAATGVGMKLRARPRIR